MREAIDEKLLRALIEGRGVSDFLVTQGAAGHAGEPAVELGVRKWYTEWHQEVVTGHAHKLKPKKNRPE